MSCCPRTPWIPEGCVPGTPAFWGGCTFQNPCDHRGMIALRRWIALCNGVLLFGGFSFCSVLVVPSWVRLAFSDLDFWFGGHPGAQTQTQFSWGGCAPPDSPLKSAAVAASASQIGTLKASRLLSQPPGTRLFTFHGGLGAEPPESQGSGGRRPPEFRGSGARSPLGRQPPCLKRNIVSTQNP